ncbi:MAG: alpha/beta hydrolase [Mycolicibacterium sp.]|nr:alpha/beta hydrolase [Mycolicibacterium sp.]
MTRPSLSQARLWRPDSLDEAAARWDRAAVDIHTNADVAVRGVTATRDFWRGSAAEAARNRASVLTGRVVALARAFVAAAAAARNGAALLRARRDDVLTTVAAAESEGYTVADDGTVRTNDTAGTTAAAPSPAMLTRAGELTVDVQSGLDRLALADEDTARDIEAAFAVEAPAPTQLAGWPAGPEALISRWPSTGQDEIAAQIAALSPQQRRQLVEAAPAVVGNTDGVPWDLRVAANRLNVADAILAERALLATPEDTKVAAEVDAMQVGVDPATWERVRAQLRRDPAARARAVAAYDDKVNDRIAFYQGLLGEVADPTGRSSMPIPRQIIAFDPDRSSLIELHGDLATATSVGVLIPGLNTTMPGSGANVATARRFTRAGGGKVAMITYLGGPFPTGEGAAGLRAAASPRFAEQMAPRLVAFSEDVNRTVDATGRDIPVTYLGHSYGGSILGTAERDGLTADRVVYVEAAGAGVGVHSPADWHNRNPHVVRFTMTAPLDWIEAVQGVPLGPHGADPDTMPGVLRLPTGRRRNRWPMVGPSTHSDVINEPSDAWDRLYEVISAPGRRPRR